MRKFKIIKRNSIIGFAVGLFLAIYITPIISEELLTLREQDKVRQMLSESILIEKNTKLLIKSKSQYITYGKVKNKNGDFFFICSPQLPKVYPVKAFEIKKRCKHDD